METARKTKLEDQRERLNNLYRFQRHFYDLTRRFFLFGRDRLLREMNAQPGESVLEVGCGTGRNLLKLSSLQPQARLFGLDAADEMLKTAGAKLDACNKQKEIILRQGLAEEFSYRRTFHRLDPFDKIFISYSLSMFPKWREALLNALDNLEAGGDLYVVDFFDGALLPVWFNRLLRWWLGLFKVHARPEFLEFLKDLQTEGAGELSVVPIGRRYAFIAHFRKSSSAATDLNEKAAA
jgi:S-adenosylmethionine-diacylgycerolhomoserine-N-methlytransferase